jgi:hypothetical protein
MPARGLAKSYLVHPNDALPRSPCRHLGLKISNFEAFQKQAKAKLFAHETAPPTISTISPTFSTGNTAGAPENVFT